MTNPKLKSNPGPTEVEAKPQPEQGEPELVATRKKGGLIYETWLHENGLRKETSRPDEHWQTPLFETLQEAKSPERQLLIDWLYSDITILADDRVSLVNGKGDTVILPKDSPRGNLEKLLETKDGWFWQQQYDKGKKQEWRDRWCGVLQSEEDLPPPISMEEARTEFVRLDVSVIEEGTPDRLCRLIGSVEHSGDFVVQWGDGTAAKCPIEPLEKAYNFFPEGYAIARHDHEAAYLSEIGRHDLIRELAKYPW